MKNINFRFDVIYENWFNGDNIKANIRTNIRTNMGAIIWTNIWANIGANINSIKISPITKLFIESQIKILEIEKY